MGGTGRGGRKWVPSLWVYTWGGRKERKEKRERECLLTIIRIDWTRINCGCGEHLRLQGAVQLGLTEGRERGVFIQTEFPQTPCLLY